MKDSITITSVKLANGATVPVPHGTVAMLPMDNEKNVFVIVRHWHKDEFVTHIWNAANGIDATYWGHYFKASHDSEFSVDAARQRAMANALLRASPGAVMRANENINRSA